MRDFAEVFERMPAEKPPPEGELPFGPRNFSMYRLGWTRVVLEGGNLGYRFGAKHPGARTLRLNWKMTAVLRKVDRRGTVIRTVAKDRRVVRIVEHLDELEFAFPAKRGLFRVDVRFSDLHAGRSLAAYREYFRVLPRRVKLRLALSSRSLGPEGTLYARVKNLGTVSANVPARFVVEHAGDRGWGFVQEALTVENVLASGAWWVDGGEASPCVAFTVPAGPNPGVYRVKTAVQPFRPFPSKKRLRLAKAFDVLP